MQIGKRMNREKFECDGVFSLNSLRACHESIFVKFNYLLCVLNYKKIIKHIPKVCENDLTLNDKVRAETDLESKICKFIGQNKNQI